MVAEQYSIFIEEAFIKPIRSVLIVDDDYPTFDEILENCISDQEIISDKSWYRNPDRIKGVIDSFRTKNRSLLVDIHDGKNVMAGEDEKIADHLHQSDLLVLDYELDKARPNDGTRAIEIIYRLMSNDHFNLVIVHTKENLEMVFENVLIGLLSPELDLISDEDLAEVENWVDEAEDIKKGLNDDLLETIQNSQYFYSQRHPDTYLTTMVKGQKPFTAFKDLCDSVSFSYAQSKLVLKRALHLRQANLLSQMNSDSPSKDLSWSDGRERWIRSDSVFVAFSDKTDEDDLLNEIMRALEDWNPQPSRLFLAKIRTEMDEYGVVAQGQALGNKYALAHWYRNLLTSTNIQRRWSLAESVSRHSDQLLTSILPRVEKFASRLVESEIEDGEATVICKGHFKVDLDSDKHRKEAEREHNAFVCSTSPQGWHLTTGHVFLMEENYWVCLSPACDMIPQQMSASNAKEFKSWLPFIAVKLLPQTDKKALKESNSNRYVFLQVDGGVKAFCLNAEDNSAPHWRVLYAKQRGQFLKGTFNFKVACTIAGAIKPIAKIHESVVVSQLRYEYALNLMQKLGVSMTRIGLDFVGS